MRHAEVETRYHSIFGGRIDMELSPRGHEQASALAEHLRGKHFAAAYASPMRRVQQTLVPLIKAGLPSPVNLPDLREVDFGDWTGLSWDEVRTQFGISAFRWLEQLECDGIANAECAESLRQRLEPCVRAILAQHPGEEVAVVCHGGVIRMLIAILLGWRFSSMGGLEIDYAGITKLSVRDNRAHLVLVNFTPWRDLPNTGKARNAARGRKQLRVEG